MRMKNKKEIYENKNTLQRIVTIPFHLFCTYSIYNFFSSANIRVTMITGDSLLTAVNVAEQLGMLSNSRETRLLDLMDSGGGRKLLVSSVHNKSGTRLSAVKIE